MTSKIIREKFIKFFTSPPRNHKEIPSASLVPENDPTVLFITAGMHPLVPYLLGEPHPLGKRLVNIQKSMRTDDIEEVGDLRHFTFFEMLGNWSLGDYFKKETVGWSFEFLTDKKWLGFDPDKIYISVFEGDKDAPKDEESISIWKDVFSKVGIKAEVGDPKGGIKRNARIFPYPKEKNWWGPAGQTGPCGPDTEMFYDTGLSYHDEKIHGGTCHVNCECGRFIEVWNDVFMQYNKKENGSFELLKQKNVDTGMGMERVATIIEWLEGKIDTPDPFKTGLFKDIIANIQSFSRKPYQKPFNRYIRIVADHTRAATFIIADGVTPSNKERGYVLRKLIRRAVRFGYLLTINQPFMGELAEKIIENYKDIYRELDKNSKRIKTEIEGEELRFRNTLFRGLKEIEKYDKITGKIAFDLYQSFGFPLELATEIAKEKGQSIDKSSFEAEFKKHQELSRKATKGIFKGGLQDQSEKTTKLHTATHLLQQALRIILGEKVHQKGSNITAKRLRFDFSHSKELTEEQIKKVEDLVNQKIKENLPVKMEIKDLKEAVSKGALTVPGVQYPEKVKVYSIGNFSKEICGGPHVDFTGNLGTFKIIKEEAGGTDIRRVYASFANSDVSDRTDLVQKRRQKVFSRVVR